MIKEGSDKGRLEFDEANREAAHIIRIILDELEDRLSSFIKEKGLQLNRLQSARVQAWQKKGINIPIDIQNDLYVSLATQYGPKVVALVRSILTGEDTNIFERITSQDYQDAQDMLEDLRSAKGASFWIKPIIKWAAIKYHQQIPPLSQYADEVKVIAPPKNKKPS